MIHTTQEVDGVTMTGLLIVVERGTGAIRVSSAVFEGDSPAVAFRTAFRSPAPPAKPGRPKHVVFDDPWLRDQVADVLKEAGNLSVTTEATPALDDAIARLLHRAGAPVAPGIDGDFLEWHATLRDLIRVSPWKTLDSKVMFSFAGGNIDGWVAILLGNGRELIGVVLYPTREDLIRHRLARVTSQPLERKHSAIHLMLEPRSGLSADELESCLRVALQFPPGLYPRVYTIAANGPAQASEAEQGLLLAAVRSITGLCREELSALASGATQTRTVDGLQVTGGPFNTPLTDS